MQIGKLEIVILQFVEDRFPFPYESDVAKEIRTATEPRLAVETLLRDSLCYVKSSADEFKRAMERPLATESQIVELCEKSSADEIQQAIEHLKALGYLEYTCLYSGGEYGYLITQSGIMVVEQIPLPRIHRFLKKLSDEYPQIVLGVVLIMMLGIALGIAAIGALLKRCVDWLDRMY